LMTFMRIATAILLRLTPPEDLPMLEFVVDAVRFMVILGCFSDLGLHVIYRKATT
jgi:hypothetical protein